MLKTNTAMLPASGGGAPGKLRLLNLQVLVMLAAILLIMLFFTDDRRRLSQRAQRL